MPFTNRHVTAIACADQLEVELVRRILDEGPNDGLDATDRAVPRIELIKNG